MYGFRRTAAKVLYKFDNSLAYFILSLLYIPGRKTDKRIVFIGMGNHGFTLLAYFVSVIGKHRICLVIDPSEKSRKISKKVFHCQHYDDVESAKSDGVFYGDIIYIASDHSSHTDHAIAAKPFFKNIYVEKPLFVNRQQMAQYKRLVQEDCKLYSGFNRPYSPFFHKLNNILSENFNLNMVINGHFLAKDHWYRNTGQGSRVLGNLTHWIDLSLRIFIKNGNPNSLKIQISKGCLDDLIVVLTAKTGKICLSFSANCEPSDGVEEFIFWNCSKSVGRISNFQKLTYVTSNGEIKKISKAKKDVGHELASLAPLKEASEDSHIAFLSSALAIKIEDMYLLGPENSEFELSL